MRDTKESLGKDWESYFGILYRISYSPSKSFKLTFFEMS
jgi:hypothetical protein